MSKQRTGYCDECQDADVDVCFACWQANEREIIDTPAVRQAVILIRSMKLFCVAGGNLHIHIEDMNLEDHWFDDVERFLDLQQEEIDLSDEPYSDLIKRHQIERELFYLLRSMPLEERYSACELADECEAPVRNKRQTYHDALTTQLREQVAASMAPDPPYGLKYLIADIAATGRRIDKHLRDQLDESMQRYIDEWDGLYFYGDAVPPLSVPVSSASEHPVFGEKKKFL